MQIGVVSIRHTGADVISASASAQIVSSVCVVNLRFKLPLNFNVMARSAVRRQEARAALD